MTDTQQLPVGAQTRPRPGRLTAAQLLIWLQTPIALLIAVQEFQDGAPVVGALFLAAAGVLVWGGVHIGRDRVLHPSPHQTGDLRQVPWDWSDIVIFLAAVFVTAGFFEGLLVPVADAISPADATVQRAIESLFAQGGFYGGAIFDIWLLAGLRRGANLYDIGWRRFEWWWLPTAVLIGGMTVYGAGLIEQYMSQLFPQAQNGQCQLVRHEFGHYLAIAIVVVCVMAPLAEETIFRGFIFGWARRAMPLVPAVLVSSVLFGLAHGQGQPLGTLELLLVPLSLVGAVLCTVYQASNSLVPSALVHAVFNLPNIILILNLTSC